MADVGETSNGGDKLLKCPEQEPGLRTRQFSPGHVRKLGLTRRSRDRRDFKEEENPEEKARRHKEQEVRHLQNVFCANLLPWFLTWFGLCPQLKPLYKELLYTIAHKLGKPSWAEVFTNAQLHQYIKEAFTMTQSEHEGLMEKAQSAEAPVYCLMAIVKEAKGILGKDVSGELVPRSTFLQSRRFSMMNDSEVDS